MHPMNWHTTATRTHREYEMKYGAQSHTRDDVNAQTDPAKPTGQTGVGKVARSIRVALATLLFTR